MGSIGQGSRLRGASYQPAAGALLSADNNGPDDGMLSADNNLCPPVIWIQVANARLSNRSKLGIASVASIRGR